MTTGDRVAGDRASGDAPTIVIEQADGAVRVTCQGDLDPGDVYRLQSILVDLVDGPGADNIDLVLPETDSVDVDLVHVIADLGGRLSLRGGHLSVTTRESHWESDGDGNGGEPAA